MKRVVLLMAFIASGNCFAQQKALQPGDTVPLLQLRKYVYEQTSSELQAGRLIILDFWSTNCRGCIAAMPVMDSLQQEFANDISILLVTDNDPGHVASFFEKRKSWRPSLSMIAGDTLLHQWFPHLSVPYHVWIGSNGVVKYVTGDNGTTRSNIRDFLKGIDVKPVRKAELPDFNDRVPFYAEGGGRLASHIRYYSLFTGYLPEHTSPVTELQRTGKGITGIKFLNQDLFSLYRAAFDGLFFSTRPDPGRIILEMSDSAAFIAPLPGKEQEWRERFTVSYEAVFPVKTEKEVQAMLLNALNLNFPFTGTIERRKVVVYELMERKVPSVFKAAPLLTGNEVIRLLIGSNEFAEYPIINKTASSRGHPFIAPVAPGVRSWTQALSAAGLQLVKKVVEADCLVIKDKPATL